MQVADEVGQFDELGQLAGGGPGEFLPRFANFRREPGQVQRRVDFFFGAAGDVVGRVGILIIRFLRFGFDSSAAAAFFDDFFFGPLSPVRNTPYSLIRSPRSFAMPRSTTLWSFEPVKYCSAAPNDFGWHDAQDRFAVRGRGGSTSSCRRGRSPSPVPRIGPS